MQKVLLLAVLGMALAIAGCPDDPLPPPPPAAPAPAPAPEIPPEPPPPPPPGDTHGEPDDEVEAEEVLVGEEVVAPPPLPPHAPDGDANDDVVDIEEIIRSGEDPTLDAPTPVGHLTDEFVRRLRPEAVVFNVPTEMEIDETIRLRLMLQPGQEAAALAELFVQERRPDEVGELETGETVLAADEMMAKLYSETLEVTILGTEAQAVRRSEPTEWTWTVKAVEGGPQRLTLTLYAIRPGTSSPRRIGEPLEYDMTVNVSMSRVVSDFASAHWEWLWTFLLAPVGGWWWQRRKKRG